MRPKQRFILVVFLSFLTISVGADGNKESLNVNGVTISLDMPKDAVLKEFDSNSVHREGNDDYWVVLGGNDGKLWLGSILFKKGKSSLVVKSWGSPGSRMAKDFMAQLSPPRTDCQFALVQTPRKDSPVKLTTVSCDPNRLVFQISEDQQSGLHKCEVEILGNPENRLDQVDFWKFCKAPAP